MSHSCFVCRWVGCTIGGKDVAKMSMMCPKCCQVWSAGKFSLRIKSNTLPSPRISKILRKHSSTPNKLNRIEASLLKRYERNNGNKLVSKLYILCSTRSQMPSSSINNIGLLQVLICTACNHESVMPMKKQLRESKQQFETPDIVQYDSAKKKKKKKDRFAGLNATAVISASPSPGCLESTSRVDRLQSNLTPLTATPGRDCKSTTPSMFSQGRASITPKSSRLQSATSLKRSGPTSIKKKMNLLRDEVRLAEHNRVQEESKALTLRNLNVKKNSKLQDFLSKREKDVHLEDRIHSLLQL